MARGRKRGVHRKRRPRRPLPGMLLHIDGSRHRWFQDERWHDLIVILDDATSEIYHAQLVEEESTLTVMAAPAGGDRGQGPVLRALQRSRQPFLADAEGGRQGRSASPDPGRPRLTRVGDSDDSGLFAAGPRSLGAQLRNLARTAAAGAAAARNHNCGGSQQFPASNTISPSSISASRLRPASAARLLPAVPRRDLDRVFSLQYERTVNRDNTVALQDLTLQIERVKWRAPLAGCNVIDAPTPGWHFEYQLWAAPIGTVTPSRSGPHDNADSREHQRWKRRRLEKSQNRLSHPAWNPAQSAGFPLSHRHHGDRLYEQNQKPKNRTFHLLQKADIFTCYEHLDQTSRSGLVEPTYIVSPDALKCPSEKGGYNLPCSPLTLIREMKDPYNHHLRLVTSARQRGIKPTARLFHTTMSTVGKWLRYYQ